MAVEHSSGLIDQRTHRHVRVSALLSACPLSAAHRACPPAGAGGGRADGGGGAFGAPEEKPKSKSNSSLPVEVDYSEYPKRTWVFVSVCVSAGADGGGAEASAGRGQARSGQGNQPCVRRVRGHSFRMSADTAPTLPLSVRMRDRAFPCTHNRCCDSPPSFLPQLRAASAASAAAGAGTAAAATGGGSSAETEQQLRHALAASLHTFS